MNRLPQKKKRGDPILAEDWNTLLDAISARTPRPGTGLELIASSGGFAYSAPETALIPRQSLPPFSVIGIEKAEESYQAIIKEGWVIDRRPKSGDKPTVKFHMPKFGTGEEAAALDAVPRPKIPMNFGDTLWCKYRTDITGKIGEVPEVIVAADDQDGTHYQPEDPVDSGTEGTYFVKLLKLEDDGGTPKVKVYQQSDIEHYHELPTLENIGGHLEVYSERDDAAGTYKLRTIRDGYGLAGEQDPDDGDGTVRLDFEAESVPPDDEASETDGIAVYIGAAHTDDQDPESPLVDGPAKFRRIAGRGDYTDDSPDAGTTEQIRIRVDAADDPQAPASPIRVIGNGRKGSRIWKDCDGNEAMRIEWNDGLITSTGDEEMEAGCDGACSNS